MYTITMQSVSETYTPSDLAARIRSLEPRIGHTPVQRLDKLFNKNAVKLFAKKEWMQLSGSVKARAAYYIIRNAIEQGELTEHKNLLDATSGNTGIAYATIGNILKIPVTLCLPENASIERKEILISLGAELILTSKFEGTDGAQELAKELAMKHPSKYFYADQYKNENNWKAHYHTTAVEIFNDVPDITHFVAALGTTGTFVGTGRRLRKLVPGIKLISLQPDSALHGLEGWKHLETAIVPKIYDPGVADLNLEVSTEEAYEMIQKVYQKEQMRLSPSSAAALVGAIRVANQLDQGTVLTILPDNGDKYSEVLNNLLTDDND
ncbi:MAG: PLP-dependent cysteine synthase family protein [Chitinophagales bacterium]